MPAPTRPDAAEPAGPSDPPAEGELAALRAELDAVDDALHDMLMRRYAVVARLAGSRAKTVGTALRPGREAQILRRLLARHSGPLPRAALVRVWREILAASTALQGPFAVSVFAPSPVSGHARLAREHFGAATPIRTHQTPARALSAVASGEASVAVLPAPGEDEAPELAWWPRLDAPRLQVVARLPFLGRPRDGGAGPEALVVSAVAPDPTGHDRSLLAIEDAADQSRARIAGALTAAGLAPRALLLRREGATTLALAEIDGFLEAGDARLAALPFARAWLLGAYAVPETGDQDKR